MVTPLFIPETSLDATLLGSETSVIMTFKLRLGILKLMKQGSRFFEPTDGEIWMFRFDYLNK